MEPFEKELKSVFDNLNAVNVESDIKVKNGLKYLSWAAAWAATKRLYPDASCRVIPQLVDNYGNTRPWHDDGRSGWVEVGVTINGVEIIETLPIMDLRNQAISAEKIMSTDANKAIKRCMVKAIGLHGLGLYIYKGEDMPEDESKANDLQDEIMELVTKKCKLSDAAKAKVAEFCKAAEKESNPFVADDDIAGNPRNINDVTILEKLKKQLLTVRK